MKITAKSNSQGTRSGHKEEGKEGKEIKNKPSSPESLRLSGLLADLILQNNPSHTKLSNSGKSSTVTRWATDIDKIIRLDNQPPETVERVIRWSQSDSFWKSNVLSGGTLRKQWDKLAVKALAISAPSTTDNVKRLDPFARERLDSYE